jgi:hypothetical protein
MARQRDDPETARAAWYELYTRHHRYLLVVVGRTYSRELGVAFPAFSDTEVEWRVGSC